MKKLFLFMLCALLVLGSVLFCVGCGEDAAQQTSGEEEKDDSEKKDNKDKCADGHTYGEWQEKKAPTCVADGTSVRTCSVCKKTEEQTVKANGIHSYSGGKCTVCEAELVGTASLEFSVNDYTKTAQVSRIHDTEDGNVVIPSTYKGKKVVSIGKYAFSTCTNIKTLTIPHTVKTIKPEECYFGDVSSKIEHFYIDAKNETFTVMGDCLIDKTTKTLVLGCKNSKIPNDGSVTAIGEYAFMKNDALLKIEIPSSVKTIGKFAFVNCTSLKELVLAEGVQTIDKHAFDSCKALEALNLPKGFIGVDANAFQKCAALKSITVSGSVEYLNVNAFGECSALESVDFEDPNGWLINGKAASVAEAAAAANLLKHNVQYNLTKSK